MGLTRITSDGITDGTVVNADINASAAIAGTKIDPNFGTQDVTSRYVYANDIFLGDVSPELRFTDSDNNPDYRIRLNSGILDFYDITNTTSRMSIQADGHIDIAGNLDVGAGLDVTGAITGTGDMTIDTNTLHVDSSNNRVGIGTTSPSKKLKIDTGTVSDGMNISSNEISFTLAVNNTGDSSAMFARTATLSVTRADSGSLPAMTLAGQGGVRFNVDANTERMRIDTAGNVLVGLSSTLSSNNAKLQVAHTDGNADIIVHRAGNNANPPGLNFQKTRNTSIGNYGTIVQSDDELGSIRWGGADGSNIGFAARIVGAVDGTPGANDMPGRIQFHTSSDGSESLTERMRIGSNGDVGIGTASPTHRLHVIGDGSNNLPLKYFRGGSGVSGYLYSDGGGSGIVGSDGNLNNTGLYFVNDTSVDLRVNGSRRLLINSSGNVGIGTTSPTGKFAVSDGTTEGEINPSGGICYIGTRSNHPVTLLTNATGRMTIDTSGDVGIGNDSPSCKLAIKDVAEHTAYASVTPSVTESMLQLYNNPPNETANDHATIQFGVNGGSHNRVNAISAVAESAGNRKLAFTFCTDEAGSRTEKMRITGDGNVGIGTTSPSQKLDVSGGIKATTDITLASTTAGQSIIVTKNGTQAVKLGHIGTGNEGLLVLKENGTDTIKFNGATGGTSYINAGNVGIKTTSPTGTLDVHDGTFVLSKPSTNSSSRNWRFLPDNIAAGNLGLQVSTAAGGSTFQNVLEVDKTGTIFTAQNGTAFSWPSNPGHVWYADGEARSTTANGVHYRINRMNGDGHAVQFYRGQTNMVGFISITSSSTGYGSGSSDERTKKNIEVWNEDILSKFKALSPKTFNFNWEEDGTTKHKGYIAQNELDKFPEAYPKNNLSDSGDEFYTFVPTDMTVYLMKGLKEAAEKIETLEAKVAALETK